MAEIDLSRLKIDKELHDPPAFKGRRRLRLVGGCILLVAAGIGALLIWNRRAVEVETVTVSQVYPAQTLTLLNASGYVVAQRKAAVAAKVTGRLEWLGVEEGSQVVKGQELARLDSKEAAAARDQAQAALQAALARRMQTAAETEDARRNQRRMAELQRGGYISAAELDGSNTRLSRAEAATAAADAEINVARAALRSAEVACDNTIIRAPFDAVVLTKNADLGDIVTPLGAAANAKSAVVNIADLASLQVEADVSESNLTKLYSNQPCEIQLDALPGERFAGVLQTIVPTADRSKATVLVKVRFTQSDPRILPEMSARVAILQRPLTVAEATPVTALPPESVAERNGQRLVFVVEGEKVSAAVVELGPRIGDLVTVRRGVQAGSRIVVRPLNRLTDGRRIVFAKE